MNKVYIVMSGIDYESGPYIWGVFENIEKAEKEQQRIEQLQSEDWILIEEWEVK